MKWADATIDRETDDPGAIDIAIFIENDVDIAHEARASSTRDLICECPPMSSGPLMNFFRDGGL